MTDHKPDLVIGIDLGMTCTGVAYALPASGVETIRHIQKWPGRSQNNENKVPTIVVYPKGQLTPSHWGFTADNNAIQTSQHLEYCEWFKLWIEEAELQKAQKIDTENDAGVPHSMEELERWYTDYVRLLNQHIESRLQGELGRRWDDLKIEFLFSVPTTWKPHPTVERFRSIIQRAGYGRVANHAVSIELTEAEAAAVHTAKESPALFKENDMVLVCDVGGGTTDLSALRINGVGCGTLSLKQIDTVLGKNIGSTQIDIKFEQLVQQRLLIAENAIPMNINIEAAAWEMMKGKEYQNAKCDFGSDDETDMFFVTIPKLHKTYRNDNAGIIEGEMKFQREDLGPLFDSQVTLLFDLIDQQLQRIARIAPGEQVRHFILSGGLGNSPHIRKQLTARYSAGASGISNAYNMSVRVAPDTTLVVCKGLVADRLAKIKDGKSVLGWRCCRASYGTRCRVKYNPANPLHFGQKTIKDLMDGKLYVENVVDWFIKQGQPVSIDFPIEKAFQQRITPGDPRRTFPTHVVSSDLDAELLPYVMNNHCEILCQVLSDFSAVELKEFKLKNRHFWNFGKKYYRVMYAVKVALGPADIRFELWFKGKKLSADNPIRVEWERATQPAALPAHHQDFPQPEHAPQQNAG